MPRSILNIAAFTSQCFIVSLPVLGKRQFSPFCDMTNPLSFNISLDLK